MLENLPFPQHLHNVPEFAGGHHEKLDGTGYPRGLTREEMSLAARILAVADIFEALTATDRPYKKPKKLSESLRIMMFMAKDKYIDPEIYNLFLKEKIYLKYAELFLDKELIDEINIDDYLL
jgi:HD-GYP domain-containing protein (c-di-GMP phosphodiesterase class II)